MRGGGGESAMSEALAVPVRRARSPRAADFRKLARAAEAGLPSGERWEVRVSDAGAFVGCTVGPGHWRGQQVLDADRLPAALDTLRRRIGAKAT